MTRKEIEAQRLAKFNLMSKDERIAKLRKILGFTSSQNLGEVIITPDMAKQLLEFNVHNRKIAKNKVVLLAKQLMNGEFNSDACDSMIMFDVVGMLDNGQHRLEAIIKANKSMKLVVKLNCIVSQYTDTGKPRTGQDNFLLCDDVPNDLKVTNIYRAVSALFTINNIDPKLNRDSVIAFVNKHNVELRRLLDLDFFSNFNFCKALDTATTRAAFIMAYLNTEDEAVLDLAKDAVAYARYNEIPQTSSYFRLLEKYRSTQNNIGGKKGQECYIKVVQCIIYQALNNQTAIKLCNPKTLHYEFDLVEDLKLTA